MVLIAALLGILFPSPYLRGQYSSDAKLNEHTHYLRAIASKVDLASGFGGLAYFGLASIFPPVIQPIRKR